MPTASTFTVMPVFMLKSGNKWSNRPVSFVEVVEATTIDFSWAVAQPADEITTARVAMDPSATFQIK